MTGYLAGVGNLMLSGGIALSVALYAERGGMGAIAIGFCVLASLVSGYQGLTAMGRFVASAPSQAKAAVLALATGLFSLLAGGLLGVLATSAIGKALAQI